MFQIFDFFDQGVALEVKNAGEGIAFHIDPVMLQQLQNASGFMPVIISVQPLKDLSGFLGLNAPSQTPVTAL